MKNNKQVAQLQQELRDLQRFAFSLKQELTENMKLNKNINSTKTLLIQSIKDLSRKKEIFVNVFVEAITNSKWLKLSKVNFNTQES